MDELQLERRVAFDVFGRYERIREIIDLNRESSRRLKILDVGGNGNLLQLFLPRDEVMYVDLNGTASDSNYIRGNACSLPFLSGAMDWVVSADVLEHVPSKERLQFLDDKLRVAR